MRFPDWFPATQVQFTSRLAPVQDPLAKGILWQAGLKQFSLNVPGIGFYFVEEGQILIEKEIENNSDLYRHLWSAPVAAWMFMRGFSVLHAAVAVPPAEDHAVLLAGDSGAGKSTLLAALLQQGWKMLSDELAIIRLDEAGIPVVYPAHAEILLWPDSQKNLGSLPLAQHGELKNGRGVFSADDHFLNAAKPVKKIVRLSIHNKPGYETSIIQGRHYFQAINNLLFNSHIADAFIDRGAHFKIVSALSASAPLERLARPRGSKWDLAELTSRVLQP